MNDNDTLKAALVLCSFEGWPDSEMGCDVSSRCPYHMKGCITSLTDDAYHRICELEEMLKEHEHSGSFIVIDEQTGKEADTYNIALHEDWAKHLCYCDMDGWAIQDDGSLLLLDECGRYAYADRERFKVKWNA